MGLVGSQIGTSIEYNLGRNVACFCIQKLKLEDQDLCLAIVMCVCMNEQAMAYMSVAAIAAAAESGLIAKEGEEELQWMKVCNMYGKFCNRAGEGVASALFASVAMVLVSCISAFSLFRLYGAATKNNRQTSSW